jgi:hypothetical protein
MKTKIMIFIIVLLLSVFMGTALGGTEGSSNTLFGTGAGNSLGDDDDYATFIGYQVGYHTNDGTESYHGKYNTFVGWRAGISNTTGNSNTFLGSYAGFSNTTGNYNTFLGRSAGNSNTIGYFNTFLGGWAGYSNTAGNSNTFQGYYAGVNNTTGNYNTFLGYVAGYLNTTGSGNVFLGYTAGYSETGSNKLYIDNSNTSTPLIYGEFDNDLLTIYGNLEVIGPDNGLVYLSDTTADNTAKVSRMVLNHYSNAEEPVYLFGAASTLTNNFVAFGGGATIGNAATQIDLYTAPNTTTLVGTPRITIKGNGYVGIGTQSPAYLLQMAGGAYTNGTNWYNASSREYKDNIKGLKVEDAFETLQGLNPVTFSYKASPEENHVGFIAEDVPDLISTKDRKGLSPMDIVAVLTKVVQEQQRVIQDQQKVAQKHEIVIQEQKKIAERQQGIISTLSDELKELKKEVGAKKTSTMTGPPL